MKDIHPSTERLFERYIDLGLRTAVFDLDGTLAKTNITQLYFYLRRQSFRSALAWNIWRSMIYAGYGPPFFILDRMDRATFQTLFFRWYERYSLDKLRQAGVSSFDSQGRHLIIDGTAKLLQWLVNKGVQVEIHSSNIEPFVEPFARCFGVQCVAIPVQESPTGCRVEIDSIKDFKINQLKKYDPRHVAVIADSSSDLPALQSVAFPLVVKPKLPAWARAAQYPGLNLEGEIISTVINPITPRSFSTRSCSQDFGLTGV